MIPILTDARRGTWQSGYGTRIAGNRPIYADAARASAQVRAISLPRVLFLHNPKPAILFVVGVCLLLLLLWPTLVYAAPNPILQAGPIPQADFSERCWAVADEQRGKQDDVLVSLNKETGVTAYIGDIGTKRVEAIAFGPDRRLYALDGEQFGTIDLATAKFTPIGTGLGSGNGSNGRQDLNDIDGLTFSVPNAQMYGVLRRGDQTDLLFVVDWQTGALVRNSFGPDRDYVEIAKLDGLDDIDDIAVDVAPDADTGEIRMYGLANNGGAGGKLLFITVSGPNAGAVREIANLRNAADGSIVDDMEGLAFDQNGTLFGSTGDNGPDRDDLNRLFQIDTGSGTTALKGAFPKGDNDAKDIEALGCLTEIPDAPHIAIEKATNGFDADEVAGPDVPLIQPGDPVNWTYVVTNTGDVDLTNVQVTDDQGVAVTCPQTTLAVGASMTCTGTGIAQPAGYENCATVTGDGAGRTVNDTDCSHYFGPLCAVSVEKRTNGEDADAAPGTFIIPGSDVTWRYRVANTGNVALGPITLVDDNGTPADASDDYTCTIDSLNAGASDGASCVHRGTAIEGQYSNLATVTGTPVDDSGTRLLDWAGTPLATCSADDPSHYFGMLSPTLVLEKLTNGVDADEADDDEIPTLYPGDPVTWTYIVTNTGSSEIRNITVVDDKIGEIVCPKESLAGGETMTCTATGIVPIATDETGCESYTNLGTAMGDGYLDRVYVGTTGDDDVSRYRCLAPDATIDRSFTISWSLQVTNTGLLDLSDVVVDGGEGVTVTCPQTSLAVGAAMTCTAEGDIAAYAQNGTASGIPTGQTRRISAPIRTTPIDGIDLEAVPASRVGGQGVEWSYIITNNVAIDGVTYDLADVSLEHTVIVGGDQVTEVCTKPRLAYGEMLACFVTITRTNSIDPVVSIGSAVGTPIARTVRSSALTARASLTAPGQNVTPISGDTVTVFRPTAPATIGGRVFRDEATIFAAPDGLQNPSEPGVAGVTVTLHHFMGTEVARAETDADGNYLFDSIAPDDYYLVFMHREFGAVWTLANRGNEQLDSDAVAAWVPDDANAARTAYFRIAAGTDDRSWGAGLTAVSDQLFYFLPQIALNSPPSNSSSTAAGQEVSK